jgi:hypothetical protein
MCAAVVAVLNFLEAVMAGPWSCYPELPRGYCCWTLELDDESKEEVPPLGTEVLIGEVREAIAFC